MRNISSYFIVLLLILVLGCSKFRKIEKNPDWRVKYEGAMQYYAKEDYYKASVLFEQILPIVRGLPEGEKVQFYLAYCHYNDKLYLLASERFKTFYETYGRSAYVEEARYMHAYSLFVASPNSNLDQSSSIEAMSAMQLFLNRYPDSKFREQAIESIITMQEKLEKKGFDNARQYYKMRRYKSAIVALSNFQKNFPDSKYMAEAQYLIVLSQYNLAEQSIYSRQEERYKEVIEFYQNMVDDYPDSPLLREAQKYYTQSLEKLNRFKNNSNL